MTSYLPDIPKMEGKNRLPEYGLYINGSVHRLIRSSPRFSISLGRVIKCNSNRCRCLVLLMVVAIFWIFPCSFLVGKIMYLQKGQVFTDIGFQAFRFLQIQENGPTFESDSVLSTSFSKRADRKTRKCVIATQLPGKVFLQRGPLIVVP